MGKSDDEKKAMDKVIAEMEAVKKRIKQHLDTFIELKKLCREKLESGWENGAPILPERRKKLEEHLKSLDVLVDDYDFPDENDQIH
ncbi:MAG: hypothetical protein GY850_06435 [bacterium]|nr:hypothetical protein [bacterium]